MLSNSFANYEQQRPLPSASIAVDLQQPEGVQGGVRHSAPGNLVGQVLNSWMFLGTDFMISVLASPHI